jgi:hypothetical protein
MEWSHAPLPCMVNAYLFQAPVQAGEPEDTILAVSRRGRSLGSWEEAGKLLCHAKQHYHQHR